jgi:hypothetical protein
MNLLSVRAVLWVAGLLGVMWSAVGLFSSLQDVGVGLAVAAGSVIGWGLCDWLERHE